VLSGAAGNDMLDGGPGKDTLDGGVGNDRYVFGRGSEADSITDYDPTAGNTDILMLGAGVKADQMWLRHVGDDLEIDLLASANEVTIVNGYVGGPWHVERLPIAGGADKVTIVNWYVSSAWHIERLQTADGHVLLDSKVQNLVDAMAGFAPPAVGQTALPPDYRAALGPVIAASWG